MLLWLMLWFILLLLLLDAVVHASLLLDIVLPPGVAADLLKCLMPEARISVMTLFCWFRCLVPLFLPLIPTISEFDLLT
jgi:hypothetical protein